MVGISAKLAGELSMVEIIIGIVISVILVSFWQRFLENFLYRTMGFDRHSTYQGIIIAVAVTIIFMIFLTMIRGFARDVILGTPIDTDVNNLVNVQGGTATITEAELCPEESRVRDVRRRSRRSRK